MKLFDIFKKNTEKAKKESFERLENFPEMLMFKLLYIEKPTFDLNKISEEIRKYISNFDILGEDDSFIFTFPDYPIELADAKIFFQTLVNFPEKEKSDLNLPEQAFQQNWHWKEANDTARQCNYEILVTDIMSRNLPYKKRVNLFMSFLVAIIKATEPEAIYSSHGQKIINPKDLINSWDCKEKQNLYGICNVRLFTISDSLDNEIIMDTLGLHSIGLPDFQIKFSDFEVNEIANLLWNYAYYVYEYGDHIENGNTFDGLIKSSKWGCKRQISLLEPNRIIINVIPN